MEPLFNDFLDHLYRSDPGEDNTVVKDNPGLGGVTGTGSVVTGGYAGGKGGFADVWHKHNAIFVLNPSKVGYRFGFVISTVRRKCSVGSSIVYES